MSKLNEINNYFKLPIYYNDKKMSLKKNIIDDLELVKTIEPLDYIEDEEQDIEDISPTSGASEKEIVEEIDDVLSAADRLENYNINMSLTNSLRIELVPKDTGDNTFKFIGTLKFRQFICT